MKLIKVKNVLSHIVENVNLTYGESKKLLIQDSRLFYQEEHSFYIKDLDLVKE
jgi:hypothetical protein